MRLLLAVDFYSFTQKKNCSNYFVEQWKPSSTLLRVKPPSYKACTIMKPFPNPAFHTSSQETTSPSPSNSIIFIFQRSFMYLMTSRFFCKTTTEDAQVVANHFNYPKTYAIYCCEEHLSTTKSHSMSIGSKHTKWVIQHAMQVKHVTNHRDEGTHYLNLTTKNPH